MHVYAQSSSPVKTRKSTKLEIQTHSQNNSSTLLDNSKNVEPHKDVIRRVLTNALPTKGALKTATNKLKP